MNKTILNEACLGYFGIQDIGPFYLGICILILGYGIFTYYLWDMGYQVKSL